MTEIFRHFRLKQIDAPRLELIPCKKGGISYMLKPSAQGSYDFWIYICPLDAEFSAKQAVYSLRLAENYGCVPWGNITLDGSPLIDLLVDATVKTSLPTETSSMVKWIKEKNKYMNAKLDQLKERYKREGVIYYSEESLT